MLLDVEQMDGVEMLSPEEKRLCSVGTTGRCEVAAAFGAETLHGD